MAQIYGLKVNQGTVKNCVWPTHISAVFPQGTVKPSNKLYLTKEMPGQTKVLPSSLNPLSFWVDGSIKWAHIYANLPLDTREAKYCLRDDASGLDLSGLPAISVTDTTSEFLVDTGKVKFSVPKQFIGIKYGLAANGIILKDDKGIQYKPGPTSVVIEYQDTQRVVFKATGSLIGPANVPSFANFVTRIIAFADSKLVKFDHAIIFTDDMRKHRISQLGFDFGRISATYLLEDNLSVKRAPYRFDLNYAGRGSVIWQWPPDLKATSNTPSMSNVYKFSYLNEGPVLDSNLPNNYYQFLRDQKETAECKVEYAAAANLSGVAMHIKWGMLLGNNTPDEISEFQKAYNENPIGIMEPVYTAQSNAVGQVAELNSFNEIDSVAVNGILGQYNQIDRYKDYGWHIYGNMHHAQLINENRPSLHRSWKNGHYQDTRMGWNLFLLNGSPDLLKWARIVTDNYCSVGQCKITDKSNFKQHQAGGFWHCKGLLPWGSRDWGMDQDDSDCMLYGHWVDPSSLLFSWLIDADYWSKDGYELWFNNIKWPQPGTAREFNTTLVHAIIAYEYKPTYELQNYIQQLATSLRSKDILLQQPGSIWEPTYLLRYWQIFSGDAQFNQFIVESADKIEVEREAIWSFCLGVAAYRLTQNKKYLTRTFGVLTRVKNELAKDPIWDKYGHSIGPDGDGHFAMQWPYLKRALSEAGLTPSPVYENGVFLSSSARYNYDPDLDLRGTTVLMLKEQIGPLDLTVDAITVSGGDLQATRMQVRSPTQTLLNIPIIPQSNSSEPKNLIYRPSSWRANRREYSILTSEVGIFKVIFAGDMPGIFVPLNKLPFAQIIRRKNLSGTSDKSLFRTKLTSGFFVPIKNPVKVTITGLEPREFSKLKIGSSEKWIGPGQSFTFQIDMPTYIDIFSDRQGYCSFDVEGDTDECLLYGINLNDINKVKVAYFK